MGEENDSYDETKVRNQSNLTLDIPHSIMAAVTSFRDEFRKTLGSEPTVEILPDNTYRICTYGGGEFQVLGQFSITQMPGCCGVVVFYHASVTTKFSGRGLGRLFLQLREKAAILAGYTVAHATVLESNIPESKLLHSEGWEVLTEFKNKRTRNKVLLFQKELK